MLKYFFNKFFYLFIDNSLDLYNKRLDKFIIKLGNNSKINFKVYSNYYSFYLIKIIFKLFGLNIINQKKIIIFYIFFYLANILVKKIYNW